MKVLIAVPTNRGVQPQTLQCLLDLVAHGGYEFEILIASHGYTVAENRTFIGCQAVKSKSDFLLFIDDDMTFEPDLLDTLIANDKAICGTAYHSRGNTDTMPKYVGNQIMALGIINNEEYIDLDKTDDPIYKDTFECFAVGTGIMLIKCEVFNKVQRPWFKFEFHSTGQVSIGEDWYFCREAKKSGYKIYTDPKPKVGHLGYKTY